MSGVSRTGRRLSDYEQGNGGNTTTGPNDQVMDPSNRHSGLNSITDWFMGDYYDTSRRTGEDDNDFYRDNAEFMPGYNIDGMPSGAWAQDRATNHVGHNTGEENPWDRIRRGLVENESARIEADREAGGTGRLGFGDVYDAHVEEYADSGGGGNQFIDPGSFALAMYAAPALEALGIDSGAVTGASIDIFNNPEDSAFEGWAKRMGLGMLEMGAGAGMMGFGALTGNMGMMGTGAGVAGLGLGGMLWNTGTALFGEDGANFMSDMSTGALNMGGDILEGAGNLIGGAADAIGSLFSW